MPATEPYRGNELLAQMAKGDAHAFENIYNHYFNSVYFFALRFVPNSQEAEDITTETFLKCWQKRSDFENLHKLQSFLYTTTRNACINVLRAEKRETERERQLNYLLNREDHEGKELQLLTANVFQYIYEEIEKLPPQEKAVFKMAYLDGLNNEQISELLNISNQSVRNYKTRALKTLRLSMIGKDLYILFILELMVTGMSTNS